MAACIDRVFCGLGRRENATIIPLHPFSASRASQDSGIVLLPCEQSTNCRTSHSNLPLFDAPKGSISTEGLAQKCMIFGQELFYSVAFVPGPFVRFLLLLVLLSLDIFLSSLFLRHLNRLFGRQGWSWLLSVFLSFFLSSFLSFSLTSTLATNIGFRRHLATGSPTRTSSARSIDGSDGVLISCRNIQLLDVLDKAKKPVASLVSIFDIRPQNYGSPLRSKECASALQLQELQAPY